MFFAYFTFKKLIFRRIFLVGDMLVESEKSVGDIKADFKNIVFGRRYDTLSLLFLHFVGDIKAEFIFVGDIKVECRRYGR